MKRSTVLVPSFGGCLDPLYNFLGTLRILPGQRASSDDALDRFRHIEPASADRRIERHYPILQKPRDEVNALVALKIVKYKEHPQWW